MSTPFDTALRVQQRAVETIRIAISIEIARQMEFEQAESRLIEQVKRETALAARQALPESTEWLNRMRLRHTQLRGEVEYSGTRVAMLRQEAAEAHGAMRVIEGAAGRHREDAEREADAAEQARLDDFSAARLFGALPQRVVRKIA